MMVSSAAAMAWDGWATMRTLSALSFPFWMVVSSRTVP